MYVVGNVASWADTTTEPEAHVAFFLSIGHRWKEIFGHRVQKPIWIEDMSIWAEYIGVAVDGPDVGDENSAFR